MEDDPKSKDQLVGELDAARKRIAELEGSLSNLRQREQAQRESDELFSTIFRATPIAVSISRISDGKLTEVNNGWCELTGFSRQEALGYNLEELKILTHEDRNKFREELLREGSLRLVDAEFTTKTGEKRPILSSIEFIRIKGEQYFINLTLDVTERKRAEEALRQSEQRLRKFYEAGMIGVLFWNVQGRILDANDRFLEMMGYSRDELVSGKIDWIPMTPPEYRHLDENYLKELKALGVNKEPLEKEVLRKDRTRLPILVAGAMLDDERTHGVAIVLDITERKKAQEERRKLEERLQQSNKMEAIGVLAGGIAHDFNNILSSVLGFTELAKMKHEDGLDIEYELGEILNGGIRARDLVKQILTFSRQTGVIRKPMVVVSLIKETLKFLRASLPATIEIRQDLSVRNSMIIADSTQISQVVMNLCANAAYAMKDRCGVLDIRLAEVVIDAAEPNYKGLKRGKYLRLSVSDTGSGIPKEIIDRIFDPFFTTKGPGEGTGMGLSVAHGIVRELGGAITVYSDPGKGAKFNVLFPLYEEATAPAHAPDTRLKTGRGKILFVDDEEGVIVSGREILERLGYRVVSTTSPIKALELFTADPDTFDLVLTDLTMPEMTGFELSEKIRKTRPDIPIVLCTGFPLGITFEKIQYSGIREVVMKPMVASELSQAVYNALNPDRG
jgi:PAS domain S-box-containing protein